MSLINTIENKIKELSGGKFQKLGDAFLAKKFPDYKLIALGSQEGTNKPTKGIPDTYLVLPNGKQIFVMYGTHAQVKKKISGDIKSVKEKIEKLGLGTEQIEKIICCHTSSNIGPEKKKKFEEEASPYELELIGINEIANALCYKIDYQCIARDHLGVSESTDQVWDIESFVKIHDQSKTNAPISNAFLGEGLDEYLKIIESDTQILLITGNAGVGKTRLGVEICRGLKDNGYDVICIKSNGQEVYQDLKRFIDREIETVLFIDDVNLVSDFNTIFSLLNFCEKLRFIITCRSYSINNIKLSLKDYKYKELSPKLLNLENINELIKQFSDENIPVKRVQSIIQISKDNARLIVLAAILSKKEKTKKYETQYEILKDYYEEIVDFNQVDFEDERLLFIVHFLEKFRYSKRSENSLYFELANFFKVSDDQMEYRIQKLYRKELLDIHNNSICKIADQTLGDYIAIKILMYYKSDFIILFDLLYKLNNERFIDMLIQLKLFYNEKEDDVDVIIRKSAYNYYSNISHDMLPLREEFLLRFGQLLSDETIVFIKEAIQQIEEEQLESPITLNQISNGSNNVRDNKLELLGDLIESGQSKISLQLLILYLKKKPSLLAETFTLLINCFDNIQVTDRRVDFMREVMEMLRNAKEKDVMNIRELSIKVYENFLLFQRSSSKLNRAYVLTRITYSMPCDDNFMKCRKDVLEQLYTLYKDGKKQNYGKYIMNILLEYSEYSIKYIESHSKVIESDLTKIKNTFFHEMQDLSLLEEKVLNQLIGLSNKIGCCIFNGYKVSERQKVYRIISSRSLANPYTKEHKEEIGRIINEYEGRWERFFINIKLILNEDDEKLYIHRKVIINLFYKLSFIEQCKFIQAMLKVNYKAFWFNPADFLIKLKPQNYSTLLKFVPSSQKNEWKLATLLLSEEVTKVQYDSLIKLLEIYQIPLYYNVTSFLKFEEFYPGFLSKGILHSDSDYFWIPNYIRVEEAERLVRTIGVETLETHYLSNLDKKIDESRSLFLLLCRNNKNFGVDVLKSLYNNQVSSNWLDGVVDQLGEYSFFDEVILAFSLYVVRDISSLNYWWSSYLEKLLKNRPDLIQELLNRASDEDEFIKILNMGTEFLESNTLESLYVLMKQKGYGVSKYKNIQFRKYRAFWSTSLIPVIEEQIRLLETIRSIFSDDIKYIGIVSHLNELIGAFQDDILLEKEREF